MMGGGESEKSGHHDPRKGFEIHTVTMEWQKVCFGGARQQLVSEKLIRF